VLTLSIRNPRTFWSHIQRAQTTNSPLECEYQANANGNVLNVWVGTYATGELEIQVLLPLSTYPPLSSRAVVSIEDGSEPWLGSVSPKHPMSSPDAFIPVSVITSKTRRDAHPAAADTFPFAPCFHTR
jgi:hypothetical protein